MNNFFIFRPLRHLAPFYFKFAFGFYVAVKNTLCVYDNKLHPTVPHMVTKRLHFNHTIESSFSYRKKSESTHDYKKGLGRHRSREKRPLYDSLRENRM